MPLKFGFLSTSDIGVKQSQALIASGVAVPYAVGSRDLQKAKLYAEKNKFEKYYGSYEEVLSDPNVEAVYIPVPTALKTEWALKTIQAKKHVLLDKPLPPANEVQQIITAAKEAGVHFMDNTMFVHHKRTAQVHKEIYENNLIGDVRHVNCTFSWPYLATPTATTENIRLNPALEPAGGLGDVGWYTIRAALIFMNWQLPQRIFASLNYSEKGAVIEGTAILFFKNGRQVHLEFSLARALRQFVEIVGGEKSIRIPDFVVPFFNEPTYFTENKGKETDRQTYSIVNSQGNEKVITVESSVQLDELVKTFVKDVEAVQKKQNPSQDWSSMSYKTQLVLDCILQSAKAEKIVQVPQ